MRRSRHGPLSLVTVRRSRYVTVGFGRVRCVRAGQGGLGGARSGVEARGQAVMARFGWVVQGSVGQGYTVALRSGRSRRGVAGSGQAWRSRLGSVRCDKSRNGLAVGVFLGEA